MDRASTGQADRPGAGGWGMPPERPQATRNVIDVWRASREQSRSRELLLAILSQYLGEDPGRIALARSPAGKPRLAGRPAERLRFNLSHSAGLTLIAVTAEREVGIDVEVLDGESEDRRGRLDEVAIARRALGSEQARRLERLEGRERRVEFLRAWARYEAQIKCLGIGLGGALARGGQNDAEPDAQPDAGPRERRTLSDLWVRELDVAADALAAVAVEGPDSCELRLWEWVGG